MPAASRLAVGFATIDRPQAAQRLIRSIRRHFPAMPIYVADQSRQTEAMATFYAAHDVTLVRMPYDAGVTASRNRLTEAITEEYFLLCDDDFVLGARTRFAEALRILDQCPQIGVVGGRLYDFDGYQEWVRNWEIYLHYDPRHRTLTSLPIYELAPRVREIAGIPHYFCDAVLNFAVFRTAVFSETVRWDERFKSNGEHEDFYLNLKVNSHVQVVHLPTLLGYHHHPEEFRQYRLRLRDRNEGWRRFFEKWGIEQHIELGLGVRTIDDVSTVVIGAEARARFFINPHLSLQRTRAAADTLAIGSHTQLAAVGVLDAAGGRHPSADGTAPADARLLLDLRSRSLLVAAATESRDTDATAADASPAERYWLESSASDSAVGATDQKLHFRHDAVLHPDADFFLWYRAEAGPHRPGPGGAAMRRRLAARLRWTGSNGAILVWRSRRSFLDLEPAPYWRPLLLDVPLLPRGCTWLRFELIGDGGSPAPVCTGFLFAGSPSRQANGAAAPAACDVTAFARLPNDGASPEQRGQPLDEVGRAVPKRRVALRGAPVAPAMTLLTAEDLRGLDVLFFSGWPTLGRALVSARLPPPGLAAPPAYALPTPDGQAPGSRVYGYGATTGFLALELAATSSG